MKTTIDSAGRLVIPKEIRRQAGLKPGMVLEVRWQDGCIEIAPLPLPLKMVRKGRLVIAVPQRGIQPLTAETVEQTRTALRQRHSSRT